MRSLKVATLFVLVAGCGSAEPPPTFVADGVDVYVESIAPFTRAEDFAPRVSRLLTAAAAYWSGSLEGERLRVVDGGACGWSGVGGCAPPDRIEVSTSASPVQCAEALPIAHEAGHAILRRLTRDPDAAHADPRWSGLATLNAQLADGFCY